jgi:3-hydroxyacyl-[acyl-carrier-protein] dehydratase
MTIETSDPSPLSAPITEILCHIPHRYPFLLIDRVERCEPNKRVRVIKNVTRGEWFLADGARPDPVMPQLLVVEALAQAAGVLCHYSGMMSRIGKALIFFAGIDRLRYRRDVRAGDTLVLECELKRNLRGVAKLSGRASVDGATVLESDLTAVIRAMSDLAE